jgi:hypothetical protein
MSPPAQPSAARTDLEIVVNWRMMVVGAALALLLIVVPAVGWLCMPNRDAGPKSAGERPITSQPAAASAPRLATRLSFRIEPEPTPVAKVRETETLPPVEVSELVPPPTPMIQPDVDTIATPTKPSVAAIGTTPRYRRPRSLGDEYEMLGQLRAYVSEVDLNSPPKPKSLLESAKAARETKETKKASGEAGKTKTIEDIVAQRSDLAGLPLQLGKECKKEKEAAKRMGEVSRQLGRLDAKLARGSGKDPSDDLMRDASIVSELRDNRLKLTGADLAVLVQKFQAKGRSVRLELVKMLKECKDVVATRLLAQRALFDLDQEVREAAIAALKGRQRTEYRTILHDGLRYPWSAVAEHAADALVALEDRAIAPKLVALLDQPNPEAPYQNEKGEWVVAEMVRINHLRNCVLCHAPSTDRQDPVRGLIPSPGKEIPIVYYESVSGDFVRADITYLRQDFSVAQPVENAAPWPYFQRYDYLIRRRPATPGEVSERARTEGSACYPQREAVLYALRELTGRDVGASSAEWKQLVLREWLKNLF